MRELDFELIADDRAPRYSRARVDDIGGLLGPRSTDVKLVISELVTNSVRHAPRTEKVRVRVRVDDENIRLEVMDDGPGFLTSMSKSDGLGLVVVDQLADEWGVHVDGKCTVWVELARSSGDDER
jgi:anti-sigma regulatory factor (Ser/Thr protein kinase)